MAAARVPCVRQVLLPATSGMGLHRLGEGGTHVEMLHHSTRERPLAFPKAQSTITIFSEASHEDRPGSGQAALDQQSAPWNKSRNCPSVCKVQLIRKVLAEISHKNFPLLPCCTSSPQSCLNSVTRNAPFPSLARFHPTNLTPKHNRPSSSAPLPVAIIL